MIKKSRQKFKYRENERAFALKQKTFFKGLSIPKNFLRPEGRPFKVHNMTSGTNESKSLVKHVLFNLEKV